MATIKQFKTNFVAGELDPLMIGRPDIKHYHNAARRMRNVVALPQGGFRTRPGSDFVAKLPASNVRMASFQYTTSEVYLFVFTHLEVRIFYEGQIVKTLPTPYRSQDISASFNDSGEVIQCGINWTQSLEQMIVYHESIKPHVMKRGNSHFDWTIEPASFDNIPRVDFGEVYTNGVDEIQQLRFPRRGNQTDWSSGDTFTLVLEDEETEPIQYNHTEVSSGLMASRIQEALSLLPNLYGSDVTVSAVPSATYPDQALFTVTFNGKNGKRPWGAMNYKLLTTVQTPFVTITVSTRGERPGEDAISDLRGWPRCGVFFQGRHWMAGSRSLPNTVWATRSATDWDLNNKKTTDDYGFMYSADTDDVPAFINIYPGRHLQIFSTSGEFYVPISDREGVTPKNMVLRRTSSRGSKAGLRVAEADGATIFVQSGGKALREFIFADTEAAYQANSISLLSSHLMLDPLSLSLRRASSTDAADLMFMPNPDGSMTVFCTLRTQEVNAYTLWTTAGKYRDVCAIYDEVYIATEREVNGVSSVFIERMNEASPVDCGVSFGAESSVVVDWLPSTRLSSVLDGAVMPDIVSGAGGVADLPRPSVGDGVIGLPWPEVMPEDYPGARWLVETLPVDAELQDGSMFGRKRRIVWVAMRINDTSGLIVNGSRISNRRFGSGLLDRPPPRVSGIKKLSGLMGWDYEGKVSFYEVEPTQATVLAVSWAVSI